MLKFRQPSLSKPILSLISISYIYALNLFVNHSLDTMRAAIWPACLLLTISLLIGLAHRYLLKLFLAINILIASVAIFAKWNYHIIISEDILLSLLISETDLTAEMISLKAILWVFITGLLPIIWLFLTKIKPTTIIKQTIHGIIATTIGCGITAIAFLSQGYTWHEQKGHIRDPRIMEDLTHFSPLDAEFNFQRARKSFKGMKEMYRNVEVMSKKYHYTDDVDDLLIVFIIGESSRGDHFSLNGYSRNTNPQLAQLPNVYSFAHAQSCDTLTINSVHCLSSPMLKSQSDRKVHQSSFGEILRSLGYHTNIYSLQTLSGFYNYLGYDKLLAKYAILSEQKTGAKDESLLPYIKQTINNYQNGKQLLIVHTLGSHQTYADRISPQFATFQPYCHNPDVAKCSPNELINAYDNTILGVDNLLAQTITALQHKKAILIYASDHGESLGEGGHYFHGMPVAIAPKEQFNIPIIIWLSDAYRQTSQGKLFAERIANYHNSGKAISHDYLFHSTLGCVGVHSDNGGIDDHLNICADQSSNTSKL